MISIPMLKGVLQFRGFILTNVQREFQAKYRNSMLGAAWTVLNPLAMIVVYTVVFSQVMKSRLPGIESTYAYSIYLCAGTLTWGLFAEIVGRGTTVFLDHAGLIKKVNFPRICLPIIVVVNALVNFAIVFALFLVFLVVTDNFPGLPFLAMIPLLLIVILFAIGLGILLGVLNVFFRDVSVLHDLPAVLVLVHAGGISDIGAHAGDQRGDEMESDGAPDGGLSGHLAAPPLAALGGTDPGHAAGAGAVCFRYATLQEACR